MSGTYKATGINLKAMPLGESDRLLTVLTRELGLIRVVAPGARKHQSSLRGRSGLFVLNELLIAKGRNLDKIIQADSLESYPGLSQDLRKLTASQYVAELVLYQALSNQPQEELFCLLREQLALIERLPGEAILASLAHATFHLLRLAGVAPQVYDCCFTKQSVVPDFKIHDWQVGFSIAAGGVVSLSAMEQLGMERRWHSDAKSGFADASKTLTATGKVSERAGVYLQRSPASERFIPLTANQLALLQRLPQPQAIYGDGTGVPPDHFWLDPPYEDWLSIERLLRYYAEYHFERPIRSATLIDTCFCPVPALF
jgi:DNA repair protein RecO (recombination protein O)